MAKQKPCEECKHYEKCCYYGGWTDAQWIGVKDRLQKRGKKVLVYMNSHNTQNLALIMKFATTHTRVSWQALKKMCWHGKAIM